MTGCMTLGMKRMALSGAVAAVLMHAAMPVAWAGAYDTPNPRPGVSNAAMNEMMNVEALAAQMSQMAAIGDIGKMDFGKMILGAAVSFAASKLNLNPALTGILTGGVMASLSGQDLGASITQALSSSSLVSNLLGGGIQGAKSSSSGSFGAFGDIASLVVDEALSGSGAEAAAETSITVKATNTVKNADGSTTMTVTYSDGSTQTATTAATNTPTLSADAAVDTTGVNYMSGQYDGMTCQEMDGRFIVGKDAGGNDIYDSNYMKGYASTHVGCAA